MNQPAACRATDAVWRRARALIARRHTSSEPRRHRPPMAMACGYLSQSALLLSAHTDRALARERTQNDNTRSFAGRRTSQMRFTLFDGVDFGARHASIAFATAFSVSFCRSQTF